MRFCQSLTDVLNYLSASFELLRKEHQKVFQERQKSNPDLRKNDFDFTELLGESKDEKERPSRSDEVNNNPSIPNHSTPPQSIAPRPLVPPGFASTILERKQGEKPQVSRYICSVKIFIILYIDFKTSLFHERSYIYYIMLLLELQIRT